MSDKEFLMGIKETLKEPEQDSCDELKETIMRVPVGYSGLGVILCKVAQMVRSKNGRDFFWGLIIEKLQKGAGLHVFTEALSMFFSELSNSEARSEAVSFEEMMGDLVKPGTSAVAYEAMKVRDEVYSIVALKMLISAHSTALY